MPEFPRNTNRLFFNLGIRESAQWRLRGSDMYIYVCIYVNMYMYMYIYIYMGRRIGG